MTWLALLVTACGSGSGDSRDADTTLTQPLTSTEVSTSATASTSTSSASAAPTTSGSGTSGELSTSGTTMPASATDASTTALTSGSSSSGDVKLDLPVPMDMPIPVHDIPGLKSITFWETTGNVTDYTFLVGGPELNNLLPDPLSPENRDIQGTSVEFYDVYYSEEDGTFNADGSYLTIAGSFGAKLPAGGGLNLAEISLNYDDNSVEYGSFLASFLGLGDNYAPGSEPNAIDGKLETPTTMGNNVDEPNKRLRVTLGFKSSLMPG